MNSQSQSKIVLSLSIVLLFVLSILKLITEQTLLIVIVFALLYFILEYVVKVYVDFLRDVRNTPIFPDNRSVNFLSWDALKFILILVSLLGVLILGINKVLNNETIATLLGSLIGSLLTLKGSYFDVTSNKQNDGQKSNPN